MLYMKKVSKRFTLHHQHGTELQVLHNVDLNVSAGECVVLDGPSGMGKSTLLKLVYANYRASSGLIEVCQADGRMLELTQATPRELVRMRRDTVGYVSQFLRVIPRVSALDVVAEPLVEDAPDQAHAEASRPMIIINDLAQYSGPTELTLKIKAQPGDATITQKIKFLGPNPNQLNNK